jgi:hypothetical protein
MTIHDYIKKHSLILCQKYPDPKPEHFTGQGGAVSSIASVFVSPDQGECSHFDKFEVFGNEDKTRFVSLNVSKGQFRIVHADLIVIASPWQPTDSNYALQSPITGI